jgi:hypothetical protein
MSCLGRCAKSVPTTWGVTQAENGREDRRAGLLLPDGALLIRYGRAHIWHTELRLETSAPAPPDLAARRELNLTACCEFMVSDFSGRPPTFSDAIFRGGS